MPFGRFMFNGLVVSVLVCLTSLPARIDKLIRAAGFPIPTATIGGIDYRDGRGINPGPRHCRVLIS